METVKTNDKQRESGIELFRIISMLIIVAHHYVVNSGIMGEIVSGGDLTGIKSLYLLLFGWGGKTGINCFVLITGYFMCKSKITVRKFLKLFLESEFYRLIIYIIFCLTGYGKFSVAGIVKVIFPFFEIGKGFTAAYLLFFLFIPFLNICINAMDRKKHLYLIMLSVTIYTILPTFLMANIQYNYITWFIIIYFIGSYLRLYPNERFNDVRFTSILALVSLLLSWFTVIECTFVMDILPSTLLQKLSNRIGVNSIPYYFVADSHKFLALTTAVTGFLFFKNLKIGYKKWINTIASSTFGVFLIHAASDNMRKWLWSDICQNVKYCTTDKVYVHSIVCVVAVFCICTVIDMVRIKFIEKPFFKRLDRFIK